MTRSLAFLSMLLLATVPLTGVAAFHPNCTPSSVSTYGYGSSVGGSTDTTGSFGVGVVTVTDTNAADCDGDGVPGDWDGDYDAGIGGAAFGYGPWATDPDCNYGLHLDGPNVAVNDFVWGSDVSFVTGEDDQSGPVKVQDPVTLEYTCTTDGNISPCPSTGCDPMDPTQDADDCLSPVYVGVGATCGSGGGDGLYWVFLGGGGGGSSSSSSSSSSEEGARPLPSLRIDCITLVPPACDVGNPPTIGTLTAF